MWSLNINEPDGYQDPRFETATLCFSFETPEETPAQLWFNFQQACKGADFSTERLVMAPQPSGGLEFTVECTIDCMDFMNDDDAWNHVDMHFYKHGFENSETVAQ